MHALACKVMHNARLPYGKTARDFFAKCRNQDRTSLDGQVQTRLVNAVTKGFRANLGGDTALLGAFVEHVLTKAGTNEHNDFWSAFKAGTHGGDAALLAEARNLAHDPDFVAGHCRTGLSGDPLERAAALWTGSDAVVTAPALGRGEVVVGNYVFLRPSSDKPDHFAVQGLEVLPEQDDRGRLVAVRWRQQRGAGERILLEEVRGRIHFVDHFLRVVIEPVAVSNLNQFTLLILEAFRERALVGMPGIIVTGNSSGHLITAFTLCLCVDTDEQRNALLGNLSREDLTTRLRAVGADHAALFETWHRKFVANQQAPGEPSSAPTAGTYLVPRGSLWEV